MAQLYKHPLFNTFYRGVFTSTDAINKTDLLVFPFLCSNDDVMLDLYFKYGHLVDATFDNKTIDVKGILDRLGQHVNGDMIMHTAADFIIGVQLIDTEEFVRMANNGSTDGYTFKA